MINHAVLLLIPFLVISEARVTFPQSEVLQSVDLVDGKVAQFNCAHGCYVYADVASDSLKITSNGEVIKSFSDIAVSGKNPSNTFLPNTGNVIYRIENKGGFPPKFVFYVIASDALNINTPVYAPTDKMAVVYKGTARYAIFLSSFDSVEYSGFKGTFPKGYPKIYSTGSDVVDQGCNAVYVARSQRNAEQSWPIIYSPISTVDFGYEGDHQVSVNYKSGQVNPMKNGAASTVYMSPGYVGCPFSLNQAYYSTITTIADPFNVKSTSLDITASCTSVTEPETVRLMVNSQSYDLVGTTSFTKRIVTDYFAVALAWNRRTPSSSFAIQLDFGVSEGVPDTLTSTTQQPTTSMGIGRSMGAVSAALFIIVHALIR